MPTDPEFGYARYSYDNQLNHIDYGSGLLLTAIIYLVVATLLRGLKSHKIRNALLSTATFLALGLVLNSLRTYIFHWPEKADIVQSIPLISAAALGIAMGALFLIFRKPGMITTAARILLIFCLPLSFVAVLNAGVGIYKLAGDGKSLFTYDVTLVPKRPSDAAPARAGKTVLIVFDEWDQRLTFESPPPDVELNQLNKLRQTAFFATQAVAPSHETIKSIPSLLTGREILEIGHIGGDDITLTYRDHQPQLFSNSRTIFHEVRDVRHNIAVVATAYHPYCKLFAAQISSCWGGAYDAENTHRTLLTQIRQVFRVLADHIPVIREHLGMPRDIQKNAGNPLKYYLAFKQAVLSAITDPSNDFVYVHWMLPHRPYIYDRFKNDFTDNTDPVFGYLDMLELMDRTIGEIRSDMESKGIWDATTLILTADHSWLQSHKFDGVTDLRVPLVVKYRGQTTGLRYDQPFNGRRVYDLVSGMLKDQISSPADFGKYLR